MAFDIGLHAIDLDIIFNDVIPFIKGEHENLASLELAYNVAKNRYIANAWGLLITPSMIKDEPKSQNFDPFHIVYGRPFFVSEKDPDKYCEIISFYIHTTDSASIENCIKEQIGQIDERLLGKIGSPDLSNLPSYEEWTAEMQLPFNTFRQAYKTMRQHQVSNPIKRFFKKRSSLVIKLPMGDDHPIDDLFYSNLLFQVITYCSFFSAGWMERGNVWPSLLINEAGLNCNWINGGEVLLQDFSVVFPEFNKPLPKTLIENYSVGGVVLPNNIPHFRQFCTENHERLVKKDDHDDQSTLKHLNLALLKLNECLSYAEKNNLALVESSEILSALQGDLS